MPPKIKITKEDILNSALNIIRKNGAQALNARAIAADLGCSTQPVFSNFQTMEDLHTGVIKKAEETFAEYIKRETASGKYPVYKASGMAYIRFAKEEKELFKFLYMRNRKAETNPIESEINDAMVDIVKKNTETDTESAKLFHLEMWAYVHGIASMFATEYLNLDWELVSKMLTDAYQGLNKQLKGVE